VRRYLAVVERLVVESPEQYLWMHRRWKSRPTGAPWLYHDLGKPLDLRLLEAGAA
jgi:lauroyl/myristoyl acyltransferase